MRPLVALALVLLACGPSDRHDRTAADDAPSATASRGPESLVLRVPRAGGRARAYRYPRLDSAVWRSTGSAPPIERFLAFDEEAGLLAYVDAKGRPGRIDLRLGGIAAASTAKLAGLSSVDGSSIYGLTATGGITRLTPSGNWSFKPPRTPRALVPQPDGSLIVLAEAAERTVLWRLRPPADRITDTVSLPKVQRAVRTAAGDRVYFTVDTGLIGVRGRDLALVPSLRFRKKVRSLAPTPSGDRLYVVTDSSDEINVVDRYTNEIETRVELPGRVIELRMDPVGRYLLARPVTGDSIWVVAIGTDRLIGALPTTWRADLPFVASDGAIALASGDDVRFVDGETLGARRTIRGGAKDLWYPLLWDGFRPRAAGLDQPVTFEHEATGDTGAVGADTGDIWSGAAVDTGAMPAPDTGMPRPAPRATPPPVVTPPRAAGFLVSYAALLSESKATELANSIDVGGRRAHIITAPQPSGVVYRVVMGPYRTRADAERTGRQSGRDFWVYEERP